MKHFCHHCFKLLFVANSLVFSLLTTSQTQAQIVPDATLPNPSTTSSNGNATVITGGTQVGSNLFHSFQQFSVPTDGSAYFNNLPTIENIISRVTGRGGIAPSPTEPLQSDAVLSPWVALPQEVGSNTHLIAKVPSSIVEAQGWVKDANGDIILVAQAPNVNSQSAWLSPASCLGR